MDTNQRYTCPHIRNDNTTCPVIHCIVDPNQRYTCPRIQKARLSPELFLSSLADRSCHVRGKMAPFGKSENSYFVETVKN